jgi:hypothetical protein
MVKERGYIILPARSGYVDLISVVDLPAKKEEEGVLWKVINLSREKSPGLGIRHIEELDGRQHIFISWLPGDNLALEVEEKIGQINGVVDDFKSYNGRRTKKSSIASEREGAMA